VVNGTTLEVTPLNGPVDYVGGCICMDLSSAAAVASISKSIGFFSHLAHKYNMSVEYAAFFFNTYLLPRLEFRFHHVQPTQQQAHEWDMILVRCFNSLCDSPFFFKPEALESILGVHLPSHMEAIVKVSESYLRLNGIGQSCDCARFRWMSRDRSGVRSKYNRLVRVASVTQSCFGWSFEEIMNVSSLHLSLPVLPPSPSSSGVTWMPNPSSSSSASSSSSSSSAVSSSFASISSSVSNASTSMCTSSRSSTRSLRSHSKASSFFCDLIPTDVSVHHLRLHDQLLPVIFGFYGSYGAALSIPPSSVRVFTDGSAPQQGQHLFMNDIRFYDGSMSETEKKRKCDDLSTSWAAVYEGDYHLQNWKRFSCDEVALKIFPERASDWFGGVILSSTSCHIFMAELQAITRVLLSLPPSFSITVISDSLSSINAISAFMNEYSDRARLRMCGRPLLSIIAQQIILRLQAGAFVSFVHEHSHTNLPTCESRGNAIADYYADELRENQRKYMNVMPQFDLRSGERYVCLRDSTFHSVVSGDVRTAARDHFRFFSLWEWMKSESQGAFAHEGVRDLCKYVFKNATRKQRALFVLVVTNIIHKKRVSVICPSSSSMSSSSTSSSSSFSSSSLSTFSSSSSSSLLSSSCHSQRRFDVIDATCSSCQVVMNVGHLLLFCSSFQKQRQEVTQQMRDALSSHLKQQHFSVHSLSLFLNGLSFHQLLFLLISLPPSFTIVNRHPLVLQQIKYLCACCTSSNHHACESLLLYDHASFLQTQTSKSKVYGQSAIVYQSELPMNMIIRWAFGGFSYHEFSSRLKPFMNQPQQTKDLFEFIQVLLFDFAISICSLSLSHD
jgi:hypothetical protein